MPAQAVIIERLEGLPGFSAVQGGAIRGRVCAFLAPRAEHPNTQAWGRRKDVNVCGCSDDCARCGTAKVTRCQLTHESRGNGGGLRPWVWLRLRAAAGGNWTPD